MDLYHALLAQDGKKFKSNANALEETNIEAYNALMMHNSSDPINTKGVDDSNYFEDLDGQISPISGGGGEIGSN